MSEFNSARPNPEVEQDGLGVPLHGHDRPQAEVAHGGHDEAVVSAAEAGSAQVVGLIVVLVVLARFHGHEGVVGDDGLRDDSDESD